MGIKYPKAIPTAPGAIWYLVEVDVMVITTTCKRQVTLTVFSLHNATGKREREIFILSDWISPLMIRTKYRILQSDR